MLQNPRVWFEHSHENKEQAADPRIYGTKADFVRSGNKYEKSFAALPKIGQKKLGKTKLVRQLFSFLKINLGNTSKT